MRRLFWLLLLFTILFMFQRTAHGTPCVLFVDIDGVIHPVTVSILERAFDQARRESCGAIILRINTPGGIAESARACVERMLRAPAPVVAWVAPSGARAASAGFFLLEAADAAAMAPGTSTGAAHPVILGGPQPDEVMRKKLESDAAAWMRTLATRRERNVALAEKAVVESRSFTDQEALDAPLIDAIVADENEMVAWLGQTGARRLVYEPTVAQKVQGALSDPNLALVCLVLGLLGLYLEFTTPGVILPGVLGGILTLLGLASLAVMPVTWAGIGLLLLAISLFVLEAKVVSHGVLGAGGAVAMVLGALLLIDSPIPELRIRLSTALGLSLPFAAITTFLVTLVVRARARAHETGVEAMVGHTAVVLTPLDPSGYVFVHGERWRARSPSPVPSDAQVRVVAVQGLELLVEPISPLPGG
jgi:membrane-bound serine protease (ClpP class)